MELHGEWELNPVLLLEIELSDTQELLDLLGSDEHIPRGDDVFRKLTEIASQAGAHDFTINPQVLMANFSYAKIAMVRDLERARDLILESPLICAIAGDGEARRTVRANYRGWDPKAGYLEIDNQPPADEFLVYDADSSQNFAINAVLKNIDIVINGPPGTGKSQTIVNLIATLAARGKSVLFVAEKRAAIDVVIDRLDKVGLKDLVMDLHEGAESRKTIIRELKQSLDKASTVPEVNLRKKHNELMKVRKEIVEHNSSLHEIREPWGKSVYEIQSELAVIDRSEEGNKTFDRKLVETLTDDLITKISDDLQKYMSLGGFDLERKRSPWSRSFLRGRIASLDQVKYVQDKLNRLADQTIPHMEKALQTAFTEVGIHWPLKFHEIEKTFRLLNSLADILSRFNEEVFELDISHCIEMLGATETRRLADVWHSLVDGAYRRTIAAIRSTLRNGAASTRAIRTDLSSVAWILEGWNDIRSRSLKPQLPRNFDALRREHSQFLRDLDDIDGYVGGLVSETIDFEILKKKINRLRNKSPILGAFPSLHELKRSLKNRDCGRL